MSAASPFPSPGRRPEGPAAPASPAHLSDPALPAAAGVPATAPTTADPADPADPAAGSTVDGPARPRPSRYWAAWRTTDFERLARDGTLARTVAVLPVAAIEQHGPHLPLAVDTVLLDGVVAAALPLLPPDLPVLVLPTQALGFSPEHVGFAGTLSLSAETLIRLWTEIGDAVARTGVRKLLLLNGHGGQVGLLDVVGRDLRLRHGMMVWSSNWFSLPQPPEVHALFPPREHRYGVHAGDMETSMMLALQPERVDMAAAADFASASEARAGRYRLLADGRSAKLSWHMQDYNPAGAVGDAAAATADKGRALLAAAAQQLAALLGEICDLPLPEPASDRRT